jgi:hypothetical protein
MPESDAPSRCGPPHASASAADPERARLLREFFMALRRGFHVGRCRDCEAFHMLAKLCLEEYPGLLSRGEREEVGSWLDAGSVTALGFGCEGACAVIPLYARLSGLAP